MHLDRAWLLPALSLLLVSACARCPGDRPPSFSACGPPCEASMGVEIATDAVPEPFLRCEGVDPRGGGLDPCDVSGPTLGVSSWTGGDAPLVVTSSPTIYGGVLRLEAESVDGGRARLCRFDVTDVETEACLTPYECAIAGTLTLTPDGTHGVFHAEFARGTMDGAF